MRHFSFCFLIIERDAFIAQDMREGLSEACGICGVRRYISDQDVLANEDELQSLAQLPVIVTKRSLLEVEQSGLGAMARRNGWPIVIRLDLDSEQAVAEHGWLSLPSPFVRSDLARLVDGLWARYPQMTRKRA